MTIDDLRHEYLTSVVGKKLLAEISAVVEAVRRRYPALPVYTGRELRSWNREAIEDLTQEVFLRLLASGHAELRDALDRATDVAGFRAIVSGKVKQALYRGSGLHTVVHNQVRRARPLLESPPFERRASGYQLLGRAAEARDPNDEEIREAALRANLVPRESVRSESRAPRVYTNEQLKDVLRAIAAALPCTFSLSDVERILSLTLTSLLPGVPEQPNEEHDSSDQALSPEDAVVATRHAEAVVAELTTTEKILLRGKLSRRSDGELARMLGCSRPTIDARNKRLRRKLEQLFDGSELADAILERVSLLLATEGPESV